MIVLPPREVQSIYNRLREFFGIEIDQYTLESMINLFTNAGIEDYSFVEKMRKCVIEYDEHVCYAVGGMILGYILQYCNYTNQCDVEIVSKSKVFMGAKTSSILPAKKIIT